VKKGLLAVAVALPLLVGGLALWIWSTIPPTPDPASLPSQRAGEHAPGYATAVAEGQRMARELLAEEKLPSLSVAVAVDGTIAWAEAFGWADLEWETPATPSTRYRIGGVTQALTAAAVGRLVDQGRVDLDAPVQEYVPAFPQKEWPVTLRHLMAHAAGLRPHRGEGGLYPGPACEDTEARLASFLGDPLRAEPGTEIRPSTFGWVLVGEAIAGAGGEPYHDFVRREILTPLGLRDTGIDDPGRTEADCARFYYPRLMLDPRYGLQDAPEVDFSCWAPAVGFLSTPSDLVRFASGLLEGSVVEPETLAELQRPFRPGTEQALGWMAQSALMGPEARPTRIVGQGLGEVRVTAPLSALTTAGQVAGGTATLLTVPEHGLAIAVASNVTAARNVAALARRLADLFLSPGTASP